MASLTLVQGPAGGGKSAVLRELIASGEIEVAADVTTLWAALGLIERGVDGKYPVRDGNDPALALALYLQTVAARHALAEGRDVGVTTSRRGQEARWQGLADEAGAAFRVRTVDPGQDVVQARLSQAMNVTNQYGEEETVETLSDECRQAIARWYGGR